MEMQTFNLFLVDGRNPALVDAIDTPPKTNMSMENHHV